jgi:hypothetical protein
MLVTISDIYWCVPVTNHIGVCPKVNVCLGECEWVWKWFPEDYHTSHTLQAPHCWRVSQETQNRQTQSGTAWSYGNSQIIFSDQWKLVAGSHVSYLTTLEESHSTRRGTQHHSSLSVCPSLHKQSILCTRLTGWFLKGVLVRATPRTLRLLTHTTHRFPIRIRGRLGLSSLPVTSFTLYHAPFPTHGLHRSTRPQSSAKFAVLSKWTNIKHSVRELTHLLYMTHVGFIRETWKLDSVSECEERGTSLTLTSFNFQMLSTITIGWWEDVRVFKYELSCW